MNLLLWFKVILVFAVANLFPVFLMGLLYKFKIVPKALATISMFFVIIISNKLRDYFNFGENVNSIASYSAVVTLILFIILSEKYKWFDQKEDEDDRKNNNSG